MLQANSPALTPKVSVSLDSCACKCEVRATVLHLCHLPQFHARRRAEKTNNPLTVAVQDIGKGSYFSDVM